MLSAGLSVKPLPDMKTTNRAGLLPLVLSVQLLFSGAAKAADYAIGAEFWKIEPLKFSLTRKPRWMSINPDTGLITGTSDGAGGTVTVSVTLTKEHRLVHDENVIVWGNEYEQSKTYESVGPVIQQFVVNGPKDK